MRKFLLRAPLLAPLLAGCFDDAATYEIDGSQDALTVQATQDYFWRKEVTLDLIAARLPDCQRRFTLGALPIPELELELFASGESEYTLRAGAQAWRVDMQGCNEMQAPEQVTGRPLGLFHLDEHKNLIFEAAAATPQG